MSLDLEQNKEIVRRMNEEAWGKGNLDLIDEIIAEDYIEHNPASPAPIKGPEGYKQNVQMVRTAFPDMTVTTKHLIAEGDRVVNHYAITGTHQGPLMGIEPTGQEVELEGIAIIKLDGDQIVEDQAMIDMFGLMTQLGAIDPPG